MQSGRSTVLRRRAVLGLQGFNAASAAGGGLALMLGVIDVPEWVVGTGFPDLYFPGVILLALVGGSALVAALAAWKRTVGWQLASLVAAVVMVMWIVGEIASIRAFHWLQLLYLATAGAVVVLTPPSHPEADPRPADPEPD